MFSRSGNGDLGSAGMASRFFDAEMRPVFEFIPQGPRGFCGTRTMTLESCRSSGEGGIVAVVVVGEIKRHEKPPKKSPNGWKRSGLFGEREVDALASIFESPCKLSLTRRPAQRLKIKNPSSMRLDGSLPGLAIFIKRPQAVQIGAKSQITPGS